jgi:hypothetical protein
MQKLKALEVDVMVLVERSFRRKHAQAMSTIMARDGICLMLRLLFKTLIMCNEPKPYYW